MDIHPIRTEADYDAALKEIELYFKREPEPGSPEGTLVALIVAYGAKRWPVDPPDPVDAIRYCMEQQGYSIGTAPGDSDRVASPRLRDTEPASDR